MFSNLVNFTQAVVALFSQIEATSDSKSVQSLNIARSLAKATLY